MLKSNEGRSFKVSEQVREILPRRLRIKRDDCSETGSRIL